MLVTTTTLNSLRVGIQNIYAGAYSSMGAQAWWTELARLSPSSGTSEVYRFPETMNRLREWVGPRHLANLVEKSYMLANRKFERTYALRVEDIEDDLWNNQMTGVEDIARAAAVWPNDLVYEAIRDGDANVCFDGQFFFDTDHPLEVQGAIPTTQSNLHAGTALTLANYQTIRQGMMDRLGNDGKPLGLMATHLIVPPALEPTAKRICEADTVGHLATAASTASDTNIMKGTAKVMVIPELGVNSSTTWYLAALGMGGLKPFVFQQRVAPSQIVMMNQPNDESVFSDDIVRFGVRARGAGGYGLWQLIDQCNA